MTVAETFAHRRQENEQKAAEAQRRYNQLAAIRLGWFLVAAAAVYILADQNLTAAALVLTAVGLAGFLILLKRHQRIGRERDRFRWLAHLNADEAARLERRFTRPETGQEFTDPTHPYAADLDVFGSHSLFRLLNRTHTHEGHRKLATYLLYAAPEDEILLRQAAVAELRPQLDWRQDLEALAYLSPAVGQPTQTLKKWARATDEPLPAYLTMLRWLLPALTLGLIAGWLSGLIPGWGVTTALLINAFLLSRIATQAKDISEQTYEISESLRTYRDLLQHLSTRPVEAAILRRLHLRLETEKTTAAAAIGQLGRLVENLNFRRNPYFFLLVGLISLWDLHYLVALERWKRQFGPHLADWFDVLAEWEALNSLAGFAYAHPEYATPRVQDNGLHLDVTRARHPLLHPARSVPNSLQLAGNGQTILITGSNMSGKSTFLRTIAANTVLALTGAVVAAEGFACAPVQLFTSMRTQDSLEESTSSFYAELKRLKALIERTRQGKGPAVLYFLDEILKGTNSADRHRGAKALIMQLHRTTASGFVSTHDVELGDLADTHPFIQNYSFHSDVVDGQLHFDYTLQPGVCRSFNATQLMRSIGIEMGPES